MIKNIISGVGLVRDYIKFSVTKKPLVANYEITANCNLRCYDSGCYFFKNRNPSKELSDEQWISKFKRDRKENIKVAILTGGEPMLRPKVVEAACNIFNNVMMVTNGTIPIENLKLRNYFVSLDGSREVNDKIRGNGVFDKVVKNIRGDKRATIAATISTYNQDPILNLAKIISRLDIKGITFALYTPMSFNDPLVPRDIDNIIKDIRKAKKEYGDIILVSERMLELFKSKRHSKDCYLRKGWVVTYDPQGKIKRPCVLGEKVICAECGCNIPVFMRAVKDIDLETFKVAMRLFS